MCEPLAHGLDPAEQWLLIILLERGMREYLLERVYQRADAVAAGPKQEDRFAWDMERPFSAEMLEEEPGKAPVSQRAPCAQPDLC